MINPTLRDALVINTFIGYFTILANNRQLRPTPFLAKHL
ncbi:hypothetical protein Daudx_1775 [Candidatus Desulforudis audaxviator]|nr:hypothetical protein Daudx_1775 [Candidatus Desulforudis audaxviator]